MQSKSKLFQLSVLIIILTVIFSCRKNEKVSSDPSLSLSFSTDTVMFDTVLTTVGSVTKRLMIYNQNSSKVVVSSVQLGGGQSSMYRININGTPSVYEQNLEIPGNDSIFVFVRVTINPNDKNVPFIVSDSILFITNGNRQVVQLAACGQNADFCINKTMKGNQVWDSLKAHVIYGRLRVDTGAVLTVLPGTKIYLHKNANMSISHNASLVIDGNWDHPVRIQSDRLDTYYRDLPGQWDKILFERGSRNNIIRNAVIKNGNYGLVLDSLPSDVNPKLNLSSTILQNFVYCGIYAYSTSIVSSNCVIANCGTAALLIEKGGSYDFRQLTVANYWGTSVRQLPSIVLTNYTTDSIGNKIPGDLSKAYFGNTIVYGTETEELEIDSIPGAAFSFLFDHAILKTARKTGNGTHYLECQANIDPRFSDVEKADFSIDSISPAIGKGVPMGVDKDIRGNTRPSSPSLGAYEYVKKR